MTQGFESDSSKAKVTIYTDEVKKLLKKYKKIKKYMKSPMYTLKVMDGSEKIVSELLEEADTDNENKQSPNEEIE